ncbi:MAG: 2Fe-2S iron-sulfur cluster binding domain-containing protein [Rhodospirillales bacterium]|nr:2Fe-2S iron-sulfur cluster binding domain-containing protein [Rhodospirillales bacterium]MDG4603828.1 2Fe-2S iron-sulfur cluster-binding protein [Defluviicoccus sp.]MDG4610382.1 2Fe-2S iron-sulfur cluster-binding protein [Defluviicoccus sp.]
MANVTFHSPVMAKDITVYGVAGERGTLLALAKTHKVPIPFDCGDGECGSCLVEVQYQHKGEPMSLSMQEKEKEVLRQLGKITKEEIENAEVRDMPSRHRLACQYIIRHEDIRVSFEGDQTLPAKKPAMSVSAHTFFGGVQMQNVEMFLAYSIKVEEEAAIHFDELGVAMEACGNEKVAALFHQLARYSRLHWEEAKARAAGKDFERYLPQDHMWPNFETPELTSLWGADPALTKLDALKAALEGERRGFEFYHHVAETAKDPEVRSMAKAFVKEESDHVAILERWIQGEETELKAAGQAGA